MSKIYIFKYNNYFNRIIKRESTLAGYGTPTHILNNTNFNYNDGVITNHVCNFNGDGDYLILCDDNNNIQSHWFILEHGKTRGGQFNLSLRRDLIIDYYDYVVTAPMIVSRAMIKNPDNPLLFNPEGFSFNQIKKQEYLLADASDSRWYCLYFKKDAPEKNITVNLSGNAYDLQISGTAANYFRYQDTPVDNILLNNFKFRTVTGYAEQYHGPNFRINTNWLVNSNISSEVEMLLYATDGGNYHRLFLDDPYYMVESSVKTMLANNFISLKNSYFNEITNDLVTDTEYNNWKSLNGKKVKDSNNKIYLVTVTTSETSEEAYIQDDNFPITRSLYESMIENSGIEYTGGLGTEALQVNTTKRTITVHLTDITAQSGALSFTLFDSNANYVTTDDSEYKIISLPADTSNYQTNYDHTIDPNVIQKIIRAISLEYTNEQLVDIQLLPYCPYHETVYEGTIYPQTISQYQYQLLWHTENNVTIYDGFIYYLDSANVSFNIYTRLNIGNYSENEALNKKISNEVELWRLVSPNYNGIFEFSVAKNNGVDYFNVDITLKPYNPYIHINPNFKALYGQDFDDARGLILGGDFSMPKESTAWADYEMRNKNYQIAFNRQIEHIDFQQGQERVLAGLNVATGTLQGALGGAIGGSLKGGVVGAGVGAAVGGVASLAGGIADIAMLGARQREDKDYTIDNWTYQLGNIKALPNSISKVTPLTYNNKKFPFIEKYVATEEEINILTNKIIYTSMNINAIGTIIQYQQTERTFIQGALIRLEDTGLASHEVYEIYNELMKGVYI